MRIKLSNDEFYTIKIPDELAIQEFQGLVMKFNQILKHFIKFNIGEVNNDEEISISTPQIKTYLKQDKEKWKTLRDNRNVFIDILKNFYKPNQEEFENALKRNNLCFKRGDMSGITIKAMRDLHNITPQEVGLIEFPTKLKQVHNLRLNTSKKSIKATGEGVENE